MDEAEYFKKLVEDTEGCVFLVVLTMLIYGRRFIQVAPTPAGLSTAESQERETQYKYVFCYHMPRILIRDRTQIEGGHTQKSALVFAVPSNTFPMIRQMANHANTISEQKFVCLLPMHKCYYGIATDWMGRCDSGVKLCPAPTEACLSRRPLLS